MISSGWTVTKEAGSSDSLLGCKNRPRRNWFFGVVEALKLVCHHASCVDLGSEMTMFFRDQTWPYCGVNIRAAEHTAKTVMLIIQRAGRILNQSNHLDAKHVRTQVKSTVSISHFHTLCSRGRVGRGGERNRFLFCFGDLKPRGQRGIFLSHFLVRQEKENYPAVNRWVW